MIYRIIIDGICICFRGNQRKRKLLGLFRLLSTFDSAKVWRARNQILRALGAKIGKKVVFKSGVIIDHPENLEIGNNVSIQNRCYLSAAGGIKIGSMVSIAHDCSVMSSSHSYKGSDNIRKAPLQYARVEIGDNVWIGMKTVILMGVKIGSCVVIGACSLVNRNVESDSVMAGIPSRRIGTVSQSESES